MKKQDVGTGPAKPQAAKREDNIDRCWHVAGTCLLITFLTSATIRSSGFLYVGLMDEFNVDRGQASWPICLIGAVSNLAGIVAGPVCQKYTAKPPMIAGSIIMWIGIISSSFAPNILWVSITQGILFGAFAGPLARRYSTSSVMICGAVFTSVGMLSSAFAPSITWFTITMGLLHGIGAGTLYTMLQVILSRSFDKYRATAHGIMYIGASLSALVGPQFLFFLLRSYNFRSSVLLYGGILLHTIPISVLFRSVPCANARKKTHITVFSISENNTMVERPKNTNENATEKVSIRQVVQPVLRLPIYYVVTLAWLVTCYNVEIFVATVLDYAVDKGASHSDAVFILSYISLADLVGRVLPLVADHQFVRRSTFTACNFFMMGASVTCMPFVTSYGAFVGVAVLVSCFTGCAMSICGVLLADYVCLDHLEVSYGLMGLLCAPLLLVKPFLIGYFRDRLGSYDELYYILAGLIFSLCLLWGLVAFSERRTSKRNALKTNKDTVFK